MLIWQIFAGAAALLLLARALLVMRISRRASQVVLALLFAIPAAGFALYAVRPESEPELTWVTWLSTLLIVLGLYPAFYGRSALRRWGSETVTRHYLTFANRHVLAARAFLALGLSGYLFMFEPWLGVACLAATGLWVVAWIPVRWRTVRFEVSAEIAAAPAVTFGFLVDPSNWHRYLTEVEAVTTDPPGTLAVGSEITARQRFPTDASKPGSGSGSLEERSRITAMTDASFTAVTLDGVGIATTEVQVKNSKTLLTIRSQALVPFTDALLGLVLEMPTALTARREMSLRNFERLNAVLGESSAP
jgi:hypothetical protein